jgi:glutamyl-tRNA synthetase
METTHVLRGEEWLPSAPRHVLIYEAFGWDPPVFAHLSRILGPDRSKLSKRHGAHAALEYRDQGYLPEAVVNFLALLGWSLDDHTEIIDRDTLIKHFDLDRVLPNPAVFNADKLLWMNGVYIRELAIDDLARRTKPFLERALGRPVDEQALLRVIPLVRERIRTLAEVVEMADFFFVEKDLHYDTSTLLGKGYSSDPAGAAAAIEVSVARLETLDRWDQESLEKTLRPLAQELGVKAGDLFSVIRVAVTGKTATPPLFETLEVLGRERTLARLRAARDKLAGSSAASKKD